MPFRPAALPSFASVCYAYVGLACLNTASLQEHHYDAPLAVAMRVACLADISWTWGQCMQVPTTCKIIPQVGSVTTKISAWQPQLLKLSGVSTAEILAAFLR